MKKKPLIARITEERILQLSNDLSEGIRTGTVEQWRSVALYYRTKYDALEITSARMGDVAAAVVMGKNLFHAGCQDLEKVMEERLAILREQTTPQPK